MKFGKSFTAHLEETLPEWRDKLLCYKPLKKLLKRFPPLPDDEEAPVSVAAFEDMFLRVIDEELDKLNEFFVDREEEFVIRLRELNARIDCVKEERWDDEDCEMLDIRKELVTIHGEMVLLINYSSLNFAGLLKILKKYDKRTGGLLRLPFAQVVLSQPFFLTEPLNRLVRECEGILALLFPLRGVVSGGSDRGSLSKNSPEGSCLLVGRSFEIYRGTLAALKAIRGLQKASSTQNPLSFSAIFMEDGKAFASVDDDVPFQSNLLRNQVL